jgi:endonuclease/exonuclease/phosphatase family metal-dependent hydrolase
MHQGIVTLSKYPIVNKQDVDYDAKFNLSVFSDIVVGKDTIRVVNNHLESNRITAQDMQETSKLREEFSSDKFTDITKYLSEKLSIASKVRAKQADVIAKIRKETPYKLIMCGDFNDVPSSYTYTKAKGNLNDAFCKTETGLGWTYNRSFFRFRIDYILYDNSFVSNNYKRGNSRASDHYPIRVDLYFK